MKKLISIFVLAAFLISNTASAHEMVPTYPVLKQSYMDGLYVTTMTMFNKRPEVEYYEIGVYDSNWDPIDFVSNYKIWKIPFLTTVSFDIYFRAEDKYKVTYICSRSKLRKSEKSRTAVSSRICSKVKKIGED